MGWLRRRCDLAVLALLAVLFSLGVFSGPVLAVQLDVPLWSQRDPRWAGLRLDGSPYTMGGSGCAVTSCAMVAAYFGSDKNPGQLCRALGANGGLDAAGLVYWERVPAAAGGSMRYLGRWDRADLARINQELGEGHPVIAEVRRLGGRHFVVITGRDGSTYRINDPGYGDRSTINARYGSPATAIRGIRVYQGQHAPPDGPEEVVIDPDRLFADVPAAYAYCAAIEALARAGVLSGYSATGGSTVFRPSAPLLRSQAAKVLCGVLGLEVTEDLDSTFVDLGPDDPEDLYPHEYVAAAAGAGIVTGKTVDTFKPWAEVSRSQMVTILVRAAELFHEGALHEPADDFVATHGDYDPAHGWTVSIAEANGLFVGISGFGRAWSPWTACSRGEAAQLLATWQRLCSATS